MWKKVWKSLWKSAKIKITFITLTEVKKDGDFLQTNR